MTKKERNREKSLFPLLLTDVPSVLSDQQSHLGVRGKGAPLVQFMDINFPRSRTEWRRVKNGTGDQRLCCTVWLNIVVSTQNRKIHREMKQISSCQGVEVWAMDDNFSMGFPFGNNTKILGLDCSSSDGCTSLQ